MDLAEKFPRFSDPVRFVPLAACAGKSNNPLQRPLRRSAFEYIDRRGVEYAGSTGQGGYTNDRTRGDRIAFIIASLPAHEPRV